MAKLQKVIACTKERKQVFVVSRPRDDKMAERRQNTHGNNNIGYSVAEERTQRYKRDKRTREVEIVFFSFKMEQTTHEPKNRNTKRGVFVGVSN
jgi:hypothetical protein